MGSIIFNSRNWSNVRSSDQRFCSVVELPIRITTRNQLKTNQKPFDLANINL